jgi:hypothetical protein
MRISRLQFVWDVGVVTSHTTFVRVQQVRGRRSIEARGGERVITHSSQLVSWADAVDADVATSSAKAANTDVVQVEAIVLSVSLHGELFAILSRVERNAKSSCLATESVQREVPVSERVFAHCIEKARGGVH